MARLPGPTFEFGRIGLADSYLLYDHHICPLKIDLLSPYSRLYFILLEQLLMNSLRGFLFFWVFFCFFFFGHRHLSWLREPNLLGYFPVEEFAFISSDIYHYLRPAA